MPPFAPHIWLKNTNALHWLDRFSLRHKKKEKMQSGWHAHEKTLSQSDLFIIPNRYGLYVGFLMLAGFMLGYKVQNNFILLGVIFLFLLFVLSLISSVRNLQGFRVGVHIQPRYFAGETQKVTMSLKRTQPAFRIELCAPMAPHHAYPLNVQSGAAYQMLPVLCAERGVHYLPPIKIQTFFPFGIVRCWTWLRPPKKILICPRPDERPLKSYPYLGGRPYDAAIGRGQQEFEIEEPKDPRPFEDGDLPSRINWKRFATTREMLIRDFTAPDSGEVLLKADDTMPREAALSYLCGGILVCERARQPALMILDGASFPIHDDAQRCEALNALARA